jgi:arylsulfatase A-like enzyme
MAHNLTRRSLFHTACAGSVLAHQAAAARPNIVVMLADDLGYGDLSCYGSKDIQTPNIDRLAASGMRFTNFYANSPVCSPTRAALLTGQYPDRVGVPGVIRTHRENSWGYLSQSAVLLPQALKTAGYHSAIVGKWHLGLEQPNLPNLRGFDEFHGFLGDMMDDYYNHLRHGNNYLRHDLEEARAEGHATELFTGWAIDYLRARARQSTPFFLYLAYNAPHTPIQPPADWMERLRKREPGVSERRAKLAALVEHMDASIGRIAEALKANGQLDNTLLVFTSDNGGQLDAGGTCGPLRGGKQDMYEGGIRVPMFAAWPLKIAAKTTSAEIGLSMDLYSTVCEAAGARLPGGLDSVSVLSTLRGEARARTERDLVWVRREGGAYQGRDYYALRRGDWKLLQNTPFEPYQLYNLREDPLEAKDQARAQPKLLRELSAALARHIQRAAATHWQPPA